MFDETSSVLPDKSVINFDDPKAAGNKALFTLLTARIDNQDMIRPFNGLGDKAMQQLFTRFVQSLRLTPTNTTNSLWA